MGYPDNVLAAGEHVIVHRHPHWKRLIGPVLVLILGTGLAAFGSGYLDSTHFEQLAKNIIHGVIWGIWLVIVGWLTLWPFFGWLTTHFVVTNRRVMFRHGVATRTGIDIPLARINSVEFRDRITERMLRTGTLIIESASQVRWSSTTFRGCARCTRCCITRSSTPWARRNRPAESAGRPGCARPATA